MDHPLPNGTKVLADISCAHCNIGNGLAEDIQPVEIRNHSIHDGVIRYKVTGMPISQHILVEDIKEVLDE
jgi:hypothetical protein